jgi:hypothetical protein
MRISIASLIIAWSLLPAACGPAPRPEGPIVKEGPAVSDTCCCKTSPMTSIDGKPVYEAGANRMECSTQQGTCVDDVQCQKEGAEPAPPATAPGEAPSEAPSEAPGLE